MAKTIIFITFFVTYSLGQVSFGNNCPTAFGIQVSERAVANSLVQLTTLPPHFLSDIGLTCANPGRPLRNQLAAHRAKRLGLLNDDGSLKPNVCLALQRLYERQDADFQQLLQRLDPIQNSLSRFKENLLEQLFQTSN